MQKLPLVCGSFGLSGAAGCSPAAIRDPTTAFGFDLLAFKLHPGSTGLPEWWESVCGVQKPISLKGEAVLSGWVFI